MILADNEKDRRAALKNLLPFQRKDFEGIFKAMAAAGDHPLLDPPLHEFLPHDPAAQKGDGRRNWASSLPTSRHATEALHESNPMLGHRGCRLSVTYPEILEMQVPRSSKRRSVAQEGHRRASRRS
jgi:pyruvate, orthophosphate dikinase